MFRIRRKIGGTYVRYGETSAVTDNDARGSGSGGRGGEVTRVSGHVSGSTGVHEPGTAAGVGARGRRVLQGGVERRVPRGRRGRWWRGVRRQAAIGGVVGQADRCLLWRGEGVAGGGEHRGGQLGGSGAAGEGGGPAALGD